MTLSKDVNSLALWEEPIKIIIDHQNWLSNLSSIFLFIVVYSLFLPEIIYDHLETLTVVNRSSFESHDSNLLFSFRILDRFVNLSFICTPKWIPFYTWVQLLTFLLVIIIGQVRNVIHVYNLVITSSWICRKGTISDKFTGRD